MKKALIGVFYGLTDYFTPRLLMIHYDKLNRLITCPRYDNTCHRRRSSKKQGAYQHSKCIPSIISVISLEMQAASMMMFKQVIT